MPGLVLEGGTFRPVFSCGVMDALLEEGILFPYCIGVSAGAANGISYLSQQKGRNLEIIKKYRGDKRYLGVRNLRTQRSIFGLDFVFGEIPQKLIPFDWDTYRSYQGKFLVGVTNARTGKAEYLDGREVDENFMMLRASCAIPVFFPAISIGGTPYYDGGVADPIPIRKAMADGNRRNLILLTRPEGYRKRPGKKNAAAAVLLGKKYPELAALLQKRHRNYNKLTAYCKQQERQGRAVVLRPEYALKSFESDVQVLETTYQHGYDLAKKRMEEIRNLWREEPKKRQG